MAINKFVDEIGTDLNKFQVIADDGSTYEVRLLRKATISQVGTPLNATTLNKLVDQINTNAKNIEDNKIKVGEWKNQKHIPYSGIYLIRLKNESEFYTDTYINLGMVYVYRDNVTSTVLSIFSEKGKDFIVEVDKTSTLRLWSIEGNVETEITENTEFQYMKIV